MSNKIPCGGFYLDDMLNVNDSGELSIKGGTPYQQLVTDANGNTKWEDRLAYEYTEWKDFIFSLDAGVEITGFKMPPVGDTVTVKVNGVESVETVKSAEADELSYSYIGSTDLVGIASGTSGWCLASVNEMDAAYGYASPETTVSLLVTEQHKIDEKYIQQDKDFVRPLSYYTGSNYLLFKTYYKESGEKVTAYKCESFNSPLSDVCIINSGTYGIGFILDAYEKAFFIDRYVFLPDGTIQIDHHIYGTDETQIAELAASYGYTLTTKPTT